MTKEEANALGIYKGNIVREIYGPVKEAEKCRIGINEKIKSILQGKDIVNFVNQHRLR
jgi:hypothetical protein